MLKKAFLFPGQGSQAVGMGKVLAQKYPVAEETFKEADAVLGFPLSALCFQGDPATLTLTKNAQPALLTTSVAMFRVLQKKNIKPEILVGHSLGEISALTCAGVFSFADALKLTRLRGELMQEAVPVGKGAMAAVSTRDFEALQEILDEEAKGDILSISNDNSNVQQVISGTVNAVDRAILALEKANIKVKKLNVSAPFHCALMQPAAERFEQALSEVSLKNPNALVLANVNAKPYEGKENVVSNLVAQLTSPVRWRESMVYLQRAMVSFCVEVGPGHVLKRLMRTNIGDLAVYTFEEEEEKVYEAVEASYYPFVSRAMGIAVATRNMNFDEEAYEKGVVEPYRALEEMDRKIQSEGRKATEEEMDKTVALLQKIFETKQTPEDECIFRFKELFADTGTEEHFKLLADLKG